MPRPKPSASSRRSALPLRRKDAAPAKAALPCRAIVVLVADALAQPKPPLVIARELLQQIGEHHGWMCAAIWLPSAVTATQWQCEVRWQRDDAEPVAVSPAFDANGPDRLRAMLSPHATAQLVELSEP